MMGYRCRRRGVPAYIYNDELYHFGVAGQKWGVRRYQNEDGSYKAGAEGRYSQSGTASGTGRTSGGGSNGSYAARRSGGGSGGGSKGLSPKAKKALLTAAGVAAAGAAAYGGYRLAKSGAAKDLIDNMRYERDARARAKANGEKYVKSRVVGEGTLDKMRDAASGAFGKAKGMASDAYSRAKSEFNNTKAAYKNYKDYKKSTGSSAKDVFGKAKNMASDAYSRAKSEGNNMKAVYKNYRDLKQQERDVKSGKALQRTMAEARKTMADTKGMLRDYAKKERDIQNHPTMQKLDKALKGVASPTAQSGRSATANTNSQSSKKRQSKKAGDIDHDRLIRETFGSQEEFDKMMSDPKRKFVL